MDKNNKKSTIKYNEEFNMWKSLLFSKDHNPHYLNRYVNFIENRLNNKTGVGHHILPKSMWKQFEDFSKFGWNKVLLSEREHFIAHLLLWKSFENNEMTTAMNMMSNFFEVKNSRLYEELRKQFKENLREEIKNRPQFSTKGITTVVDKDGKRFSVSTDDPRYRNGDLKHFLKGVKKSFPTTKGQVTVKDKDGNTFNVKKDDPRYLSGELLHISKGVKRKDFSERRKNKVIAKDINGKVYEVSREEFQKRNDLYGIRKDLSNLKGDQ